MEEITKELIKEIVAEVIAQLPPSYGEGCRIVTVNAPIYGSITQGDNSPMTNNGAIVKGDNNGTINIDNELQRLREENARLREELERLR